MTKRTHCGLWLALILAGLLGAAVHVALANRVVNKTSSATSAAYVDEVLADSPLGYWRLGETSGTSAADLGSAAYAGTYAGGYTLNQASLLPSDTANKSVLLDGSSGRVEMSGSGSAFNISGNLTLECLVKFVAFPADGASAFIICKGYDAGTGKTGYVLILAVAGSTKTLSISTFDGASSHGTSYDVSAWTTGTVYHVCGTYDGTNWKLYIDGSNVATTAGSGPQNSARALNLGREENSFGAGNYFNGTLDEVAVYSSALSSTRIAAHHAAR